MTNQKREGKIRAGIIGATGYAGAEIARLLAMHPDVEIAWLGSRSYAGKAFGSLFGNLYQIVDLDCIDDDTERLKAGIAQLARDTQTDVIFTATPQGACMQLVSEELLSRTKVIDMSADFRLKNVDIYQKWYRIGHIAQGFLDEAVYGLCELAADRVKNARLIANPGCYTTCSILTAYPLVKEGMIDPNTLIVDALSGVSGAGRGAKVANLYCEVNESAKAYGVASHRHTPEIEEQLGYACGSDITITFTPHLVPMNRGILVTAYAELYPKADGTLPGEEEILEVYRKYYGDKHFIRVLPAGSCPDTRCVEGSNYVDICAKPDYRTGRVIMMGALDNLMKGAASQAVQNMNLMFGLPEDAGIGFIPANP